MERDSYDAERAGGVQELIPDTRGFDERETDEGIGEDDGGRTVPAEEFDEEGHMGFVNTHFGYAEQP